MKTALLAFALISWTVAAHAADVTVTQSHTTFDVDDLDVKVGDTVVFQNKDDVDHNIQVTDADGNNEDKGIQPPGNDIRETFTKAGVYKVHCQIHPKMKLKVAVK